jgi:hypothetical protein
MTGTMENMVMSTLQFQPRNGQRFRLSGVSSLGWGIWDANVNANVNNAYLMPIGVDLGSTFTLKVLV